MTAIVASVGLLHGDSTSLVHAQSNDFLENITFSVAYMSLTCRLVCANAYAFDVGPSPDLAPVSPD